MSNHQQISKFLSLILRHQPHLIGVELDANGWIDVQLLLEKCQRQFPQLDRELLEHIVATNEKKRFAFNEEGDKIRASQGHSVQVDLQLEPMTPPEILYHGTVEKSLSQIRKNGLKGMSRMHVHLSKDQETARIVGNRRGEPIILEVQAGRMYKDGFLFYCSANGVWLCEQVPPQYIQ